jgi:hypothetical protein
MGKIKSNHILENWLIWQSIEEQADILKSVDGMIILHTPSYTIEISYFPDDQ